MSGDLKWKEEVRRQSERPGPSGEAYRDGLSAGFAGAKRKPPRAHHGRAGSWYDGYDKAAECREAASNAA